MSTSVSSVVSHFPSAQDGFATTLASTITSGATTVPLNSVAGYSNGQVAVLVVDPADATKKQTLTGIVDTSGVQLTSVVWTAGTNQAHSGGATVVDYATATHMSMVTKGILVHADQDGTLKAGAVDGSTVLADSVVTPAKLLTGTGGSWGMTTWTPSLSGTGGSPAIGNGTITGYKIQTGKMVDFTVVLTAGSTTAFGSSTTTVTFPAAINTASYVTRARCGSLEYFDTSVPAAYWGGVAVASSTTMVLYIDNSASTYVSPNNLSTTIPVTVGTGDVIRITGRVELA